MLPLPRLIVVKEQLNRTKDRAMLALAELGEVSRDAPRRIVLSRRIFRVAGTSCCKRPLAR